MGVCGLIAHKTGAAAVVMTDGDSSAMKYLREVRAQGAAVDLYISDWDELGPSGGFSFAFRGLIWPN